MRIQITGSRDFTDWQIVHDAIVEQMIEPFKSGEQVTVVHGGAKGADTLAGQAMFDYSWVDVEVYPANWDDCGNNCNPSHWRYRNGEPYCPRSGFVRNAKMIALKPDVVLAFKKRGSGNRGTQGTIDLATKAGIPVIEYWQEAE